MKELLYKMFGHKSLSKEEAKQVLLNISDGRYNDSQLSAFMTVFLMRSITTEELAGFREAILERRVVVDLDCHDAIDIDGEAEVLGYNMRSIKRKHIPQLRRKLGIVFQDFQLLTDRTVYNNLEFVLRATGWKNKQEIQDRIEEVLQLVGMSNKGYKLPNELSGGEQQRIVIARAVLNSPAIILADEPTGNLDVETGKAIVELLHNICESGSSVVMTTHNLQLLKEYPGRVYRCADHQIVDVTAEYMPRQRTIEIDLNIDN